jgi:peptide/nickel transport system substrate-binding protein
VADHESGRVTEIDGPSGKTLAAVDVGGGPVALAVTRDAVWVANSLDATVSRIDPATGKVVATVAVGSGPSGIAVAGESVWVTNQYAGTLTRIDARSNRVAATIRTRGQPTSVAAGEAAVWVGAGAAARTHRGGTLVLASTNRFASIDPAFQNVAGPNQFGKLAFDTLVTFQATGGTSGLRLVPDLALALPPPANGGTSYAFRLRRGIRYSDGRLLRASDFRRAIERLFRVGSQGADYFSGLVGSAACAGVPNGCNLARGIRTDDDAGTVEFRLTAPDPDFLYKLTPYSYAAPIPPGVPDRDAGSSPVPGTGPYRLLPWHGGQITFRRNAFFREWSHAAQPDGNPDTIVWRFYPSFESETRAIRAGTADWIFGILSPSQLRQLRLELPAQLHDNPSFIVDFIPLNTHAPPFDDVRVRQALNLAIDRGRIVEMYGGPSAATPTCQPLPAGLLGFRRHCPYTAAPQADGAWNAPDLARARRLVASSGTSGRTIDVWGANDELGVPRELPAYVASVLRSLGYRTHLHTVPIASISYAQRRGFQLSVDGDWSPDYPSASALLPPFFGCRGGYSNGYVCDHELERKMRNASSAQLRDPAEAARLWAEADRMIVDRAYWVPTVISHPPALVSKRLRNYQYNPTWDFVADQAWVR